MDGAPAARNNLLEGTANASEAQRIGDGNQGRKAHQTLDDGADNLSNGDQVSAGGTRYVVGFKGGLKFYGQGGGNDDSIS